MKKIIVLCAVASLSLAAIGQTTLTLQPDGVAGKDAEIFSCIPCGNTSRNYGDVAENCAVAWTKGAASHNIRSLIQFDLSTIPVYAVIQSAVLSLYFAPGSDESKHYGFFGSNSASIRRITSSWDEHTVTWDSQPATTNINSVSLAGSTTVTQNFPGINVTELVRDMIVDPTHSFGFMLKLKSETAYKKLVFASSDNIYTAIRPRLVVVYTGHSPLESEAGAEMRTMTTSQILKIYPNPARESVGLSINASDDDRAFVSIYDLGGREMVDQAFQLKEGKNQFSFETITWPRGLYMVIVKTSGEMITEKLLLE